MTILAKKVASLEGGSKKITILAKIGKFGRRK